MGVKFRNSEAAHSCQLSYKIRKEELAHLKGDKDASHLFESVEASFVSSLFSYHEYEDCH
jgi:hypothetical protein